MEKYIDNEYTEHIVCPKCGSVEADISMGIPADILDGKITCGTCGMKYYWQRHIAVSYSTSCVEHTWKKKPTKEFPEKEHCSVCGMVKI